MNLTLTDDELAALKCSTSALEWNKVCDRVKARCGCYPDDWYAKVVASGLLARTSATWR